MRSTSTRVLALTLCLIPVEASAQPIVVVRSESRLELDVGRAEDGLLDVQGALRDDLGAPLPDRDLAIELSRATAGTTERVRGSHLSTRVVHTARDGSFAARFPTPQGGSDVPTDFVVDATYEGSLEHAGTRATRFFDVDRARVTLRLTISGGARIDLSEHSHTLVISAASEAGGAGLPMTLADELGTLLSTGTTDESGSFRVELESRDLGPPAAGRLIVRTIGDSRRSEAQTEVPIVRFRPTTITLELTAASLGPGETLEAQGTLTDGVRPLPRAAVSIYADDLLLATVLSGEDGRFVALVAYADVPAVEGTVSLRARFAGDAPWVPASESAPVAIEIAVPTSLAWIWALATLAASLLIALWSLRREHAGAPLPGPVRDGAGVILGARASVAARITEISGIVVDAIGGEPLPDTRVQVGESATVTDAGGRFSLKVTTHGAVDLTFDGPEHVQLRLPVHLPHRGELTALTVRLVARRAALFAALRRVATQFSPTADPSLALTHRELLDALHARGASPPSLPALVSLVEVACYRSQAPSDGDARQVDALVEAVLQEHASARASRAAPSRATRTER